MRPLSYEEHSQIQKLVQRHGVEGRQNQIYTDMDYGKRQKREIYMLSSRRLSHTKVNHVSDSDDSYSAVGSDAAYPITELDKGKTSQIDQ